MFWGLKRRSECNTPFRCPRTRRKKPNAIAWAEAKLPPEMRRNTPTAAKSAWQNCLSTLNEPNVTNTHPLTSTTFDLPGYRVVRSLGVVRGIIVRARSALGDIGASVQKFFGGNISLYTTLCEQARDEA